MTEEHVRKNGPYKKTHKGAVTVRSKREREEGGGREKERAREGEEVEGERWERTHTDLER